MLVNLHLFSNVPWDCSIKEFCLMLLIVLWGAILLNKGFMVYGCRKRLFNMINDLPTIFEVVTGASKMQFKDKLGATTHSGNKSKPNLKMVNPCLNCS